MMEHIKMLFWKYSLKGNYKKKTRHVDREFLVTVCSLVLYISIFLLPLNSNTKKKAGD
jgi:hypothetical protein